MFAATSSLGRFRFLLWALAFCAGVWGGGWGRTVFASNVSVSRILIVGDSHTAGTFGAQLDRLLRGMPETQISTYGICGALPGDFFTGRGTTCGAFLSPAEGPARRPVQAPAPLVMDLLAKIKPEWTVVALGTNQYKQPLTQARASIVKMIHAIQSAGSRCAWVGPPDVRGYPKSPISKAQQAEFYRTLLDAATSEGCELVLDSRQWTHYPELPPELESARGLDPASKKKYGDGIHYDSIAEKGRAMAEAWAKAVGLQLIEKFAKK